MLDRTSLLPALSGPEATDPATLVAISFLAQYPKPTTREAYKLDLELWFAYCVRIRVHPLEVKRVHIQAFASYLSTERKNGAATIGRRIGTVAGYYRTAVLDEVIEHSPALHIKLPTIHEDPARRTWLNRWELGALMKAARDSSQRPGSKRTADWALITLMGTLGMRVSAACAIQMGDITSDSQGYRVLHTVGKGDTPSLKVLPIPTWEALDLAAGGRTAGPLLVRRDGSQMNRWSAALVVERLRKRAGIKTPITPHSLRRSFATLALQAGVPIEVVQFDMDHASSRTTNSYNRLGVEFHARASNTVAALLASAS